MRSLLIAIITAISAALGGCVIALGILVRDGVHFFQSNSAVAVDAKVSFMPVIAGAALGAAGGYFLARAFLPRR